MSLFGLFSSRVNINDGVAEFKATPGAVLLDVRTAGEYRQGHIPGSTNLPLDAISTIKFNRQTPLFVYCQSGSRSLSASKWLGQNGYTAKNIGGISAYKGPVE